MLTAFGVTALTFMMLMYALESRDYRFVLAELKQAARRWVEAAVNAGDLELAAKLCTPRAARRTRAWVGPFRDAFPDVQMETVELAAEGSTVVGRFRCSATRRGEWQGHPPTGRRFEGVDEVYFFRFADGL